MGTLAFDVSRHSSAAHVHHMPPDSGSNVHNPDGATIVRVKNVRQPALTAGISCCEKESLQ